MTSISRCSRPPRRKESNEEQCRRAHDMPALTSLTTPQVAPHTAAPHLAALQRGQRPAASGQPETKGQRPNSK
jgi:hypothetical protein